MMLGVCSLASHVWLAPQERGVLNEYFNAGQMASDCLLHHKHQPTMCIPCPSIVVRHAGLACISS